MQVAVRPRARRNALLVGAALVLLIFTVWLLVNEATSAPAECKWGASSVGPVTVKDGRVVGEVPEPETSGCKP